jgi:diapolycopene oxygenase
MQNSSPPAADSRHIVVIGAGLAGLSSTVELLSRGFRVTLVEKNQHLGGKMNVLEDQGFRFDMGPTILTLPAVIRGIIQRSGRKVEDYIDLVRLDPQWRCFYDDGTVVDLLENADEMARSINEQFPGKGGGEGYKAFIEHARRMFRLSESVFFYKDLGDVKDLMFNPPKNRPEGLMGDVLAMRMHSTVGATVEKHIPEKHIRQLCEHFLQYVGSSPFLSPAILTLIAAAQTDQGCWYSMGGTRSVARSLERIIREHEADGQATVLTGQSVKRITIQNGKACGVVLDDGREIGADGVVSNCDVQRTYGNLLGDAAAASEQKKISGKYEPACSGVVFYLGLDKQYDHLAHHDFLFSGSSASEFGDIYRKGVPATDPTLYLCVPSRTDPDQAPEGCEALYVLIHTPYLRDGQEWGEPGDGKLLDQYRPIVMNKLKTCGGMPDIEDHIVVERHLTPNMIDAMYNAEGGAIYGLASHGKLKGGFKPRNTSRVYENLYLAGGSANPGPGVPMVLMSGVTTARSVCRDFGIETPDEDFTADNAKQDWEVESRVFGAPPIDRNSFLAGAAP